MAIEFKGRDKFLEKQIKDSSVLEAINSLNLANYPNSQNCLAEFLKSIGISPEEIIQHYKSPEDIEEMKRGIDKTFEAVKTTIAA